MTAFIILIILITLINNSLVFVTPIVTVDGPKANRRTLKRNAAKRRTRQANFNHRVDRRLVNTSQPTQNKRQGHWHVPEAPKGATNNHGINPLARRFNSAVNNLRSRRRALKRLASELVDINDPEYIFT